MDSAESSIKTWLKFFMNANIPAGVATEYAISFSDNRMRLDMLPELTKDYLRDLNITVLGDVIAILKHAKDVSRQEYKARKMDSSGGLSPSPSPPPAPNVKKSSASTPSESPASRMVKRLVRKEPVPPVKLKRSADCLEEDVEDDSASSKRKLIASGRLGAPQAKSASISGGKLTVFDRLGGGGSGSESQVSSTTPDSSTRFRVTGLGGPPPVQSTSRAADSPVDRQRVTFLSETVRPSPPPSRPGGLGYRGVLKPGGATPETRAAGGEKTKRKSIPATATLASDREAAPVSARSRIGLQPSPAASARARPSPSGVRARLTRPTAGVSGRLAKAAAGGVKSRPAGAAAGGVKARLGGGGGSVKSRLGNAAR